jgi:hypothetical protein
MVSTGRPSSAAAAASTTAISMPGQCGRQRRRARMTAMVASRQRHGRGVDASAAGPTAPAASPAAARVRGRQRQAEEVLDLAGEDDDGDAGGEADRHRIGDELDEGAEPQEAHRHQHQARQEGGEDQPVHAVLRDGGRDQHDEAPAGPPIWNRLPPSSDTRKPPTMAV